MEGNNFFIYKMF